MTTTLAADHDTGFESGAGASLFCSAAGGVSCSPAMGVACAAAAVSNSCIAAAVGGVANSPTTTDDDYSRNFLDASGENATSSSLSLSASKSTNLTSRFELMTSSPASTKHRNSPLRHAHQHVVSPKHSSLQHAHNQAHQSTQTPPQSMQNASKRIKRG